MWSRRTILGAWAAPLWGAAPDWPIGANTAVTGYSLDQAIDLIREIGFPLIEIHPMGRPDATPGKFPGFEFDKLTPSDRRHFRAKLKGFRHITTHLPYTGLDYLSSDPAIRRHAIQTVEIAMEGSAFFGAKLAVLHAQPKPEAELGGLWSDYVALFRRWATRAAAMGMRIAMETGYPRSVRDYVRLIQEVNHPNFGSTIDVGHQGRYAELVARVKAEDRSTPAGIKAYNDTTIEIVEKLAPKIWHFHVHDIDPQTWQEHKPMVHGFVDYPRLFSVLRRIGYRGHLLLEIGGEAERMPGWLREAKAKFEAFRAAAV